MCFTAMEKNDEDIDLPRSKEPVAKPENMLLTSLHLPHLPSQS